MAITFIQESASIAMHNSGNFSPGYAVSAGDLLVLTWEGGSTIGATLTISDTTNGAWTVIDHQNDATNGSMVCAFVQTAAVSSPGPLISVATSSDPSVFGFIDQFRGYVGTPTFDSTAGSGQYVSFTTTQAAMVANAQSFFNNELLFAVMHTSQLFASDPPSGWTELANITRYYAIEATPTNIGLNQAFSSAATYNCRTFGIYDKQPLPVPSFGPMPRQIYVMP